MQRFEQLRYAVIAAALGLAGCAAHADLGGAPGSGSGAGGAGRSPSGAGGGSGENPGGADGSVGGVSGDTSPGGAGLDGDLGGSGSAADTSGTTAPSGGRAASAGNAVDDGGSICVGINADPLPVWIELPIATSPLPLAMYIMLDTSESMNEPTDPENPESPSKWASVVSAITEFVQDPGSQHMDVALQYFPADGASCDGSGYDVPAVPLGPLPDNADDIARSLANTARGSSRPLEGGLLGLRDFCDQFQTQIQNQGERCVAVLVSDGAPTQCAGSDGNYGPLIAIAEHAYGDAEVKIFAVGMNGADFVLLDDLAMSGGTDCTPDSDTDGFACNVGSGMTMLDALEAIRDGEMEFTGEDLITQKAQCEWGIPDPPEGETFDKNLVNVRFSEPGRDAATIGKLAHEDDCAQVIDGWYYDNEDDPTKIIACKQTCAYIEAVGNVGIHLEIGCTSKLAPMQ